MNIGIVGANGHVGAELTVILDGWDAVTPVPIVRNKLASRFLKEHAPDVRVGDVTGAHGAERLLEGFDLVVVAARVSQQLPFRTPTEALEQNKKIIASVIENAPDDAGVVFLSSIAAFGDELYGPVETPWLYAQEKRVLERFTKREAERAGQDWWALRIGNVFGPFQLREQRVKALLQKGDRLLVPTEADRPSNAVHTVTLADVLVKLTNGASSPGTYTVVNSPRWTWEELLSHYNEGRDLEFVGLPEASGSVLGSSFAEFTKSALSNLGRSVSLVYRTPNTFQEKIHGRYLRSSANEAVDIPDGEEVSLPMFAFEAVPGPFLRPEESTRDLLSEFGSGVTDAYGSSIPLPTVHSLPEKAAP